MKRIGCFHAHYSNIEHIDKALQAFDAELVHFVDPGLDRIKMDADFTQETVEKKVMETLAWIASCHVDAILITCTFFTAVFDAEHHRFPIPVIKIDEPLFEAICQANQPVVVAFTNPNTVTGTMNQLFAYASKRGKEVDAKPVLLENTFELIMQGRKSEYIRLVAEGLIQITAENPGKYLAAAQLSMVPASQIAQNRTNLAVGNHLESLADYLKELLNLEVRKEH
ncbi:hypothetical protein ACFPES_14600 [Paenibacillus sp. GCM10023248]|uniref:hypothetical protein n=1 Tax=unclassified Paenibacillus TaxID=185978 RepID=UPI002379DC9E|nr:hypothetical protein [Paenibacillus sp. MAHUQ-63]MDD9268266.1 hypothetical protein [Paenibacillus sp. MAHUQ-63]